MVAAKNKKKKSASKGNINAECENSEVNEEEDTNLLINENPSVVDTAGEKKLENENKKETYNKTVNTNNSTDDTVNPQNEPTLSNEEPIKVSDRVVNDISNGDSKEVDCSANKVTETMDDHIREIEDSPEKHISNDEQKTKEISIQQIEESSQNATNDLTIIMDDQELPQSSEKIIAENSTVEDGEWTTESILESFMEWSLNKGITLSSKVAVRCEGTAHRYGMMATEDIKKGETLFVVPRALCFNPDNSRLVAELVDYEDWLDSVGQSLYDSSGWATLLIVLMLEFYDKHSFWAPYLRLIPKPEQCGHPLFWTREEHMKELQGTTLLYDIQRDVYNIENEYKQFVLPFMHRYKDICGSTEKYSLALCKRLVAFVMAYSFTEDFDSQPSMVPMADLLNHSPNNNAHLVYEDETVKMLALRKITKGEEVFNTFGKLGNAELLQMYGYTDTAPNMLDTLPVLVNAFFDTMEKSEKISDCYFQAMISLLDKTEIAPANDFFLFDRNGMRKGPDLIQMLKILFMSEGEFEELLKSRAVNRPDSYYRKLLRKLSLAKKTDTSSGVAIIDITDEDIEAEIPEKRKFINLQEIEDTDEPAVKRLCSNSVEPDSAVGGISALTAIVIDDSDDDDSSSTNNMHTFKDTNNLISTDISDMLTSNKDKPSVNTNNQTTFSEAGNSDTKNTITDTPNPNEEKHEEKGKTEKVDDGSLDDLKEESMVKKAGIEENIKISKCSNDESDEKKVIDDVEPLIEKSLSETTTNEVLDKNTAAITSNENVINLFKDGKELIENQKKLGDSYIDEKSSEVSGEMSGDIFSIIDEIEDENDDKNSNSDIVDSDVDEIEFVSEDIRCKMSYEELNKELKQEWRDFIRQVLNVQLNSLKPDDEITVEEAQRKLSRREFYSYQIRQGQRFIMNTFLSSLT